MITASELYAVSQGGSCQGWSECHWCGSPCTTNWLHDDSPIIPFVRYNTRAKKPLNPAICYGCWRWRWKRTAITYLSGSGKDAQCAQNHSWWITEAGAFAIRLDNREDRETLYPLLLNPPLRFCMTLLDGDGNTNHLHLNNVNDNFEVKGETPLHFTINSIPHSYTTYELEMGLRNGTQGKSPGVLALVRLIGGYIMPEKDDPQKRGTGRFANPEIAKVTKKLVTAKSGS